MEIFRLVFPTNFAARIKPNAYRKFGFVMEPLIVLTNRLNICLEVFLNFIFEG